MSGIFLDTSKIAEIEKFHSLGIIRGVTTNPSIMLKDGVKGGMKGIREHSIKIAKLIDPLPLSVEVTNNDPAGMRKQALEFCKWAPNINVKLTIHGPEGELDNLKLIHELSRDHQVPINVTAMMSAQQCFLAATAGATYVSIFGGRINDMGHDALREITRLRQVLEEFALPAKIIVGSCRETSNILDWFEAGAHIVTTPPAMLEKMIVHPYSKETVRMFVADGKNFEENLKKS